MFAFRSIECNNRLLCVRSLREKFVHETSGFLFVVYWKLRSTQKWLIFRLIIYEHRWKNQPNMKVFSSWIRRNLHVKSLDCKVPQAVNLQKLHRIRSKHQTHLWDITFEFSLLKIWNIPRMSELTFKPKRWWCTSLNYLWPERFKGSTVSSLIACLSKRTSVIIAPNYEYGNYPNAMCSWNLWQHFENKLL